MRHQTVVCCPIEGCEHCNSYGHGQSRHRARDNMIRHMTKVHGMSRDEAWRVLESNGTITPGYPLELAIKEWDAMVGDGRIII